MDDGDMQLRLRTLGETLRGLRTERGFSLGEVAEGTDLSTSFLSLVENGRSDISTGRLFRVARFLGVGLGDLLDTDPPRDVIVVRADERDEIGMPASGVRAVAVAGDAEGLMMAPVICEYEEGAIVADGSPGDGAQRFVFVARGGIEITRADEEPLLLGEGDCAYIRAGHGGTLRNSAAGRSVVVWVAGLPSPGGNGKR